MSVFRHLAQTDRAAFKVLRREFQAQQRALPRTFIAATEDEINEVVTDSNRPLAVWKSRDFLVQMFEDVIMAGTEDEESFHRLSIARCELTNEGEWRDGITWDELMEIKRGIGMQDFWAVEIFPPDGDVVNVTNMRQLFICRQPAFAWVKPKPKPEYDPLQCTCNFPPFVSPCLYCESGI